MLTGFSRAFTVSIVLHHCPLINTKLTFLMDFCFLWAILEKSACPTHTLQHLWSFRSTGKFFANLNEAVALGKAQMLT